MVDWYLMSNSTSQIALKLAKSFSKKDKTTVRNIIRYLRNKWFTELLTLAPPRGKCSVSLHHSSMTLVDQINMHNFQSLWIDPRFFKFIKQATYESLLFKYVLNSDRYDMTPMTETSSQNSLKSVSWLVLLLL
jgi:hypothetical protein